MLLSTPEQIKTVNYKKLSDIHRRLYVGKHIHVTYLIVFFFFFFFFEDHSLNVPEALSIDTSLVAMTALSR